MTFGIAPRSPDPDPATSGAVRSLKRVDTSWPIFVEKPDRATARDYLAADDYYWNSGMFKASRY